jgi:hypothetical protein
VNGWRRDTRTASLTVNPTPPPASDTVNVTRAEYDAAKRELRVEATSTNLNTTLTVFVTSTNQTIGTLTNTGGGRYRANLSLPSNPAIITARSAAGGSATRLVMLK